MAETLEPADVIRVFYQCAGFEQPRYPSALMLAQARCFARQYREWELRLVVKWLQAQIRENEERGVRGGLTQLSLQYRKFFDGQATDDPANFAFDVFSDRLGLALEWAKRRAPHLLPGGPKNEQKGIALPVSDARRAELAAAALRTLE